MMDRETTIAVINFTAAVIALAAAGIPIIRTLARSARARGKTDVFIALIFDVIALLVLLAAAVAFIGFRSSAIATILLLLSGICQVVAFAVQREQPSRREIAQFVGGLSCLGVLFAIQLFWLLWSSIPKLH